MIKRMLFLALSLLIISTAAMAQVTTSSMSGKVTSNTVKGEPIIGASVIAIHEPSGTRYGVVTNVDGRFTIQGMRAGGPYRIEMSYVGYQKAIFKDINLQLGDNYSLSAFLKESSQVLNEVVVIGRVNAKMKSDRAGALTNIDREQMAIIPTVSRSMNDIMRLTPQGGNTGNGFAVGGGNYRQSYVTVDGAAFNNAFGIGSNLPAGGSPISLDALDQISVSTTPFDVRQSGFTGGAINAVTKSGNNNFYASAYSYFNNVHLRGHKVGDYLLSRNQDHTSVYGLSIGGPIIKNKLFFFVNGEYEDNLSAGPSGYSGKPSASGSIDSDGWNLSTGTLHRPTTDQMNLMKDYLMKTYGYDPGRYEKYSIKTPAYRLMARLDWNINANNKVNFRFSRTHMKNSNAPSSSTSPMKNTSIYPGGNGYSSGINRTSNAALSFESSSYMQEQNFTSFATEWNSRLMDGAMNNTLRLTYSYQDEPRTYVGGAFPTVDILEQGAVYTSFGPDPFTAGNLRQVKTFVATDELTYTLGKHNLLAGIQFEQNKAVNGFMQGGNGYYVYSSWSDFASGADPAAFGIMYSNAKDNSQFLATMKSQQYSLYFQDQMNVSDNVKLTAGLRFEMPHYPKLDNNYNTAFAALNFGNKQFATDQLPSNKVTVSPRVGFNWDLTGERKYILRGGTGYFIGRLPFVWLVSAVGNSNCGQTSYYSNTTVPIKFQKNVVDIVKDNHLSQDQTIPQSPTIIDKNLKMPAVWKSSLAFDAKLPYDIDFSVEGIFSKDFNPATVTNEGYYYDTTKNPTMTLSPTDVRKTYSAYMDWIDPNLKKASGKQNVYYITNAGHKAYYYSITTSLAKKFDFGLNLSASYAYSKAKSYGDGIGDQVSSAYYTNRYSVNGNNDMETGYGTYVAPNRIVATASYRKAYAKHFASTISFVYEGMNMGYAGGYGSTRYSYTLTKNLVGDYGSNNLIYIPGSRDELDKWTFSDQIYDSNSRKYVNYTLNGSVYTIDQQKDDFWNYIEQDSYLKNHKGQYAERGGATMPWHHQLDFKFLQDFNFKQNGKMNTLQLGVDIKNLPNMLNSNWGIYKSVNNMTLLSYDSKVGYNFQQNGKAKLTSTYSKYTSFASTYSIQFSIRYIFH